jgi:hypothetical protein
MPIKNVTSTESRETSIALCRQMILLKLCYMPNAGDYCRRGAASDY